MYVARDIITDPLHVVAVISNPVRYHSRWQLYRDFAPYIVASGAKLTTVELAYGEREYALQNIAPQDGGHQYIQVRTPYEIWHKENLVNLGLSRLPSDWKYAAWIDADVSFARSNWVDETLHQLQHWPIVQM